MRIGILFIVLIFSLLQLTFAGQGPRPDKCGVNAHMQYLYSKDPALEQRTLQNQMMFDNSINNNTNGSLRSNPNTEYTIPVVVHVVWHTNGQNVSDAQILSQIDVINHDFARRNADTINTPSAFAGVASGTNFQFCMAQTDPNGNQTNGIERRQTSTLEFYTNDDMKFYSTGGLDAWDTHKYMNIWVCNLADNVLGYAEMPDIVPQTNTFGVVITYTAFGLGGTATAPYHLGRTCTHEISHCFNLLHIWGDDGGACGGVGDKISDTPDQANETYDCWPFPLTDACSTNSPGIMFMNYMDYSDDNCMNMFTAKQSTRMYSSINTYYPSLLNSQRCTFVGVVETPDDFQFSLYPNPSSGIINLDMFTTKNIGSEITVTITDVFGKLISERKIKNPNGFVHQLDLTENADGVYFVTISNEKYRRTERIVVSR